MKKNTNILYLIFALAILCSCTTVRTPEEIAYLEKVKSNGNTAIFPIPKEKEIWSKVSNFISLYSGLKLQNQSDFLMETFNAESGNANQYAYSVRKVIDGDKFTIYVSCTVGRNARPVAYMYPADRCRINENILIEYLKTGDILFPNLIYKN